MVVVLVRVPSGGTEWGEERGEEEGLEWLAGCGPPGPQWLSTSGRSRNPLVGQFTRLAVSAGLQ